MRSLKEYFVNVDGFNFLPGGIYILDFPGRIICCRYIFEFDSICDWNNQKHIYHRNKWWCDGVLHECNGVETLVTVPSSEEIRFRKYKGDINWDELCED